MDVLPSASDIAQLVEFGDAEAYADMFAAAPHDLCLRVERIGSAFMLVADQIDVMLCNRVIGLGVKEPATEVMVDAILTAYQRAGIRNFALQISPIAQPAALAEWLPVRHLIRADNWAKVYRAPAAAVDVPTDLRIARIGPADAVAFASVACVAFGLPDFLAPWIARSVGRAGWYHYLAFDGDRPVATGALFVRDHGGWLGMGSTLPSHRRRGAQGAVIAQRIRDAAVAGCDWVVTETGEDVPEHPNPSFHNMIRTGFVLAYQRPNYLWQAGVER